MGIENEPDIVSQFFYGELSRAEQKYLVALEEFKHSKWPGAIKEICDKMIHNEFRRSAENNPKRSDIRGINIESALYLSELAIGLHCRSFGIPFFTERLGDTRQHIYERASKGLSLILVVIL